MKRLPLLLLVLTLLSGMVLAQNPAESQSNAPGAQTAPGSQAPQDQSGPANTGSAVTPNPPEPSSTSQSMPAASQSAQGENVRIPAGIVIPAELRKSLDAKKVKAGDEVVGRTVQDLLSNGKIVIPRDSKLVGHVTEAQTHSKNQPSSLGIAFDRIEKKDGTHIPMQASIQAIGKPVQTASAFGGNEPMGEAAGMPAGTPGGTGGMGGMGRPGMGSAPGAPVPPGEGSANGGATAPASVETLSIGSQGVVGLKDMTLSNGSAGQGSVISSDKHNVHLDSGTQMILRTQ